MSRLTGGEHYDLYLLDYSLPGASGMALCRSARERSPSTPILFY